MRERGWAWGRPSQPTGRRRGQGNAGGPAPPPSSKRAWIFLNSDDSSCRRVAIPRCMFCRMRRSASSSAELSGHARRGGRSAVRPLVLCEQRGHSPATRFRRLPHWTNLRVISAVLTSMSCSYTKAMVGWHHPQTGSRNSSLPAPNLLSLCILVEPNSQPLLVQCLQFFHCGDRSEGWLQWTYPPPARHTQALTHGCNVGHLCVDFSHHLDIGRRYAAQHLRIDRA